MPKSNTLLGQTLDKYLLTELIGEGGMGSVFLAEHTTIKKKVAVKVLHPYLAEAHPDIAKRMLKEAQAAAKIGHPDIADVLDYGQTDDGYHYLVMELLSGAEMSALLEKKGAFEPDLALAIADHLLSALAAAHSKGIIHRDLKPDNIFLHVDRTGIYQIKLLDFGISKFTEDGDMRMTKTGAVMGTPFYMSLEQAEGATDIDHRTDIYSTGVIIYQALSGALPYTGKNPNQVIVKILSGKYVPLETHRPNLDKALVSIINKAMSSNRDERFRSASEFKEALKPLWDPRHPCIQEAFESLGVNHSSGSSSSQGILGSGGFSPAPSLPSPSFPPPPQSSSSSQSPPPPQDSPSPPQGHPPLGSAGNGLSPLALAMNGNAVLKSADPPPPQNKKPQTTQNNDSPLKRATAPTLAEPGRISTPESKGPVSSTVERRAGKTLAGALFPPTPPPPSDVHTPPAPSGEHPAPLGEPVQPTSEATGKETGKKSSKKKRRILTWTLSFGALLFLIILVATKGFGACDREKQKKEQEAKEKKVREEKIKKEKRRRRRREPRIIRDIRGIF